MLALFSSGYFKCHCCKQCEPRSDCSSRSSLIWVHTVCLYAKSMFEKFARRCSRWHKQTTFSDADFLGILRVKARFSYLAMKKYILGMHNCLARANLITLVMLFSSFVFLIQKNIYPFICDLGLCFGGMFSHKGTWTHTCTIKLNTYHAMGRFSRWRTDDIFFLFYPENRIWHFTQTVSIGDSLHEMSNPIF